MRPLLSRVSPLRAAAPASEVRRVGLDLRRWRTVLSQVGLDQSLALVGPLAALLFAYQRWLLLGPYPPGLDGAQWLALGRGLGGVGRSSSGAYAPLVPMLAHLAESVVGPLSTTRLLAAGSCLALSLAVVVIAQALLGPGWGLLAAGAAIPATALSEPVFYGGYPQQVALAAGLVGLFAASKYLVHSNSRSLLVVALATLASASAHHLYFPLMLCSLFAAAGLPLLGQRPTRARRPLGLLALAITPALIVSVLVALQFVQAGYGVPLEPTARSSIEAWRYATREATFVWLALLVAGGLGLVTQRHQRNNAAWLFTASLVLPGFVLFIASGQPRLAPPILIGTALAASYSAKALALRWPAARTSVMLAGLVVVAALFVPAQREAVRFAEYYRVLDRSVVQAAQVIADDPGQGAVAVRQDRRGWPVGWWFEALQTRPVLVGSDAQWLAFPEELSRAEAAAKLFDGQLPPATFEALARAHGVRYLVTPTWDWIGWERWRRVPGFPASVIYEDDAYLVLKVASSTPTEPCHAWMRCRTA